MPTDVEFRLLGPVTAKVGEVQLDLGPAKQRCVLAVLLISAEPQISASTLIDRVWGDMPPDEARNTLYSYLARLRKALQRSGVKIRRHAGGYQIDLGEAEVDVRRAAALLGKAERLPAPRRTEALRQALDLWRGEPLDGLAGDWVERTRNHLRRQRLSLLTEWATLRRAEDGAEEVIARLRPLIPAYPLAEALTAQLVLALTETGQSTEAAECYQAVVRRLADELGTGPGPALLEAYRKALEPTAAPRPTMPVPAQLPAAPAGFVGRAPELARLDALLPDAGEQAPGILLVTGTPGVGKTALALTWSHRVATRFPDGQLYVNLRGYAKTPPLRSIDVLWAFLRALGVLPEQIPVDEHDAAALYRSLLAERRVLVLLDNAGSAEQVRPLLPGRPGSAVIVTSRDRLSGLLVDEGARRLRLDSLPRDEALAVLARGIGPGRSADSAAAGELVRLCGGLPLALRIAVANLLDDPACDIGDFVGELRTETPLAALETGDAEATVRSAFELSYQRLDPEQRRLFRLLSLHPGPDATLEIAAAAAGLTSAAARRPLDRLVSAHMLQPGAHGRVTFHDLMRQFGQERALAEDSADERAAAADRVAEFFLRTTARAVTIGAPVLARLPLPPPRAAVTPLDFADDAAAIAWLDTERVALLGLAEAAPKLGRDELTWLLCDLLRGYLQTRRNDAEWQRLTEHAFHTADAAGDDRAATSALISQGYLYRVRLRDEEAVRTFTRAAEHADRTGWAAAKALVLTQLGWVLPKVNRADEAVAALHEAIELAASIGEPAIEGNAHGNLGALYERQGLLNAALPHLRAELRQIRTEPAKYREANALTDIGSALTQLGDVEEAVGHHEQAIGLTIELGNRSLKANVLANLTSTLLAAGRLPEAARAAEQARALAELLSFRDVEAEAYSALAVVAAHDGDAPRAAALFRQAHDAADSARDPRSRVLTLVRYAEHTHDTADAERALSLARTHRLGVFEARALLAAAVAGLALGDAGSARRFAELSAAQCERCGYRPGLTRAAAFLAEL
ncbi:BTAD domain-containing putative transcriptional regulator [Amycolatopsis sp. NPDC059027]|uniref:AfsR/SARP family transcriptional regulator n=1 Tax=unclassified Amycolatopsis TaxID=2618356 RepID=UPI00366CAB20